MSDLTEEEAKKRVCCGPMGICEVIGMLALITGKAALQQLDAESHMNAECLCQGARCMAWRWSDVEGARGYCGLAGKP